MKLEEWIEKRKDDYIIIPNKKIKYFYEQLQNDRHLACIELLKELEEEVLSNE